MAESESRKDRRQERSDVAGAARDEPDEKKDKVLHTRISPSLDREIKRRARNLGMSVSTVVRHVLLHTFDLVEDIVNDGANLALSIAGDETPTDGDGGDRRRAAKKPMAAGAGEILGWHEAVLNLNAVCGRCNAILTKGTNAAIGIRDTPGERTIICTACLANLTRTDDDDAAV